MSRLAAIGTSFFFGFAVSGCGGGGGDGGSSDTSAVVDPPQVTVTLSADPTSIESGESSVLTWSSDEATDCVASGGWSGARATSGSFTTPPLTATTTYTLSCSGSAGSADARVVVRVDSDPGSDAPTVALSASPGTVGVGETTLLSWSSTGATSCTASDGWSDTRPTSGSFTTPPLTATTTYSLTCTGEGGTASADVTVTVTSATVATLSAEPPGVPPGGSTTLTWTSSNATSCTASGGWSGAKETSGSATVGPLQDDTTYQLDCSGANGSATAMTTVSVRIARLSWDAPEQNADGSPLTDLAGYRVYWGTSPRNYSESVPVSGAATTTYTVDDLDAGTWYFAVTAENDDGVESSYSSEVSKTVN